VAGRGTESFEEKKRMTYLAVNPQGQLSGSTRYEEYIYEITTEDVQQ